MSYPDVTLLEPLAGALDLTVEELMACRRQAVKGEEETMQNLLDISRDSVRKERRRSWQRLAAVLVLLAVTAAVVAYNLIIVRVNDTSQTFLLTETIGGENYVYLRMEGNHLLKLRCGENVQIIPEDLPEDLKDQGGDSLTFRVSYRYNRLTLEGELLSCEWDGGISLGGPEAMIGNVIGLDVNLETGDQLFGYTGVNERCDYAEGDPFLRVPVFAYTFSLQTGEKLLTVEDVVTYAQTDWDGDGESELAVRTPWEEKPYTIYDLEDGRGHRRLAGHGGGGSGRAADDRVGEAGGTGAAAPSGSVRRCRPWRPIQPPSGSCGVDPVRRIVSFHPEAGGQYLAFRSRELFLRCIDQYTAQQYRYQ